MNDLQVIALLSSEGTECWPAHNADQLAFSQTMEQLKADYPEQS